MQVRRFCKLLGPLGQHALETGKRVRNETELGRGSLSIARIAVDVVQHAFGDLSDNRALVVGTGETEGVGLGRKVGAGEGPAVGEEWRRRRAGALNGSPTITDEAAAVAAESPTITEGADEVVAATAGTGEVVLGPYSAECVGIVSLAAGLECVDVTALVGTMVHNKFQAAATAPNGLVVLAPYVLLHICFTPLCHLLV